MWSPYRKLLLRDLDRWSANGWLTAQGRAAILADVDSRAPGFSIASVLAILASVLMCFAALSLVAAHWDAIPRGARLLLLLASIWAAYIAAGFAEMRGRPWLADAAILLACGLFGASIMLVSQMYHIAGEPADGVLMWWVGSLVAGAALRSNPALALAMVLVCLWSSLHWIPDQRVHWPFLIGWGLVSAAFLWQRWWPGLHLSALSLSLFVIGLGYELDGGHAHALVAVLGTLTAIALAALAMFRRDTEHVAAPLVAYALAVGFAGLCALQFLETNTTSQMLAIAIPTLALLIAAIAYALSARNGGVLWIGYIAFSIEILALYSMTIGTIIGTSLFFLIAAVIVALLAYLAYRLSSRTTAPREVPA
jgi:uncharacterized membrane protein